MSPRRRPGRRIVKALLPIALLLALACAGLGGWAVYTAMHPQPRPHLVTPDKFELLSHRGLKVTEETWRNRDGTDARGWLLRGDEGAPAVILLHRYGADRSYLLNLGVKLNEATNFTILWPDLRGHGERPPVARTSLGAHEADDVLAAQEYLRALKTGQGRPLVAERTGLYGVELGAYAALVAASREPHARALVLDSVPADPDELLRATIQSNTGFNNSLIQFLARIAARLYLLGDYRNIETCTAAATTADRHVLLLAGNDAEHFRASTSALARCFPSQSQVELQDNLPLTGFMLASAPGEQGEAYDRRVIDFFDRTLR